MREKASRTDELSEWRPGGWAGRGQGKGQMTGRDHRKEGEPRVVRTTAAKRDGQEQLWRGKEQQF